MPTVSLTDFDSQQAEVERRRRMADLLQQQSAAPIEIQAYKGIQAPIPWTATLAKVLGSYAAARQQRDADKQERVWRERARDEAGRFIREQTVDPNTPTTEGMIQPGDLNVKPGVLDRLKGAVTPPPPAPTLPQASPQALGAALAGQPYGAPPAQPAPPVSPVQQGPLPPAAPQALGAALAGNPPQPQMAGPMVQGDKPMPPPVLSTADLAPQQGPLAGQPRARPMEEQQDRLLQASMSGNPYLEKLAPALYQRNEALADESRKFEQSAALEDYKAERKFSDSVRLKQWEHDNPNDTGTVAQFRSLVRDGKVPDTMAGFRMVAEIINPKVTNVAPGADAYSTRDLVGGGDPVQAIKASIRGIESAPGPEGYRKSGPLRPNGDRAYGAYQIMGANIPKWTKEVLGVEMTPIQFLANPEAQEKVADAKLGQLYQQFGNPGDVASVWHSGVPLAQAGNRSDGNMKTTDYAARVARETAPQPVARGRDKATADGGIIDPDTLKFMAAQALAGDKSVFTNLGRGVQGAQNIALLRKEVMTQAKAAGLSGADIAQLNASFYGAMSEARAVGSRAGAGDVAAVEVPRMAAMSNEAYAALPRGQFVPFNKLRRLVDHQLSSPEQGTAYAADVGLITAWARALNPQGVPREADIAKGERILDGAQSAEAHQAVVNQMLAEARAIQAGTKDAKANLRPGGDNVPPPPPPPSNFKPPAGSMWSPSRQQYKLPNGSIVDANGRPVSG